MKRTIQVQLNKESIDNAIKEVEIFKKRLQTMYDIMCRKLIAEGVQFAKDQVKIYGAADTWNMHDSIQGFYDPSTGIGIIKCYAVDNEYNFNYAQVIEFGSGVAGSFGTSPDRPGDWKLDINKHGTNGWWYGDGHWTMGQEPRPFMYNTYMELIERSRGLAKVRYYNVPSNY